MSGLIECIPNVSEGRVHTHIAACGDAITSVPGVRLLDTHADADHHRSVFTFVGSPSAVIEAVARLATVTTTLIDLRRHEGEHPRMGALDVVPFVPLAGASMGQCVSVARQTAERIAESCELPVFLYGHAAATPERGNLPDIRGRGFEAMLASGFAAPERHPDFGPLTVHPSAGATAVGARDYLVAFNVVLDTADASLARRIARRIRTASGGLPGVRALGFRVGGRAQVSMNLIDVTRTPPRVAYAAVARAARTMGVDVIGSEIVGLMPACAAHPEDASYLQLSGSIDALILENRIADAFGSDAA